MKKPAFLFTAFCAGILLLSSCNSDKPADSTAATTTASSGTPASGDMAGMNHAAEGTTATGDDMPLMMAMNDMMARMNALGMKGNVDHDFAHHMMEHHRGAIAMADIELRDGKDATMRQMAEKIKADQQKEIGELEPVAERLNAAPNNYKPQDPADPFTSKMKASMDEMMKNMPPMVTNPDMNFNMMMKVHHQSAVAMAQAELAHGKDTQLKEMAQKMVDAQQKEITDFKAWHDKNADKM